MCCSCAIATNASSMELGQDTCKSSASFVSSCPIILKKWCRTAALRDRCAKSELQAAIDGALKASLQMILNG